jgi:hypothetical protein
MRKLLILGRCCWPGTSTSASGRVPLRRRARLDGRVPVVLRHRLADAYANRRSNIQVSARHRDKLLPDDNTGSRTRSSS